MVIGMRFHALIMAAAEGCRCFAISYDPKVSYLMADLALPCIELGPSPSPENSSFPENSSQVWPESVSQLTQLWLETYADGEPVSANQIQSRVDRALMHQDLLLTALA